MLNEESHMPTDSPVHCRQASLKNTTHQDGELISGKISKMRKLQGVRKERGFQELGHTGIIKEQL